MSAYRKKPVEVEAWRYSGASVVRSGRVVFGRLHGLFIPPDGGWHFDPGPATLTIETLHGKATLLPGDWLIRGPSGDYWPCRNDIFEESYEPLGPPCEICGGREDVKERGWRGEGVPMLTCADCPPPEATS